MSLQLGKIHKSVDFLGIGCVSKHTPFLNNRAKFMAKTRLEVNISLDHPGKRTGDILMRWSDNVRPLGVYPVPIACIVGKPGATALLVAGIHGDEFEGRLC